jgi:hypothetical protein
METRQENPPVSMSGLRSAEPCARDPPSACRGVTNAASRAFGGVPRQPAWGRPPQMQGLKQREAMRQHRLSRTPDSRS